MPERKKRAAPTTPWRSEDHEPCRRPHQQSAASSGISHTEHARPSLRQLQIPRPSPPERLGRARSASHLPQNLHQKRTSAPLSCTTPHTPTATAGEERDHGDEGVKELGSHREQIDGDAPSIAQGKQPSTDPKNGEQKDHRSRRPEPSKRPPPADTGEEEEGGRNRSLSAPNPSQIRH